MWDILMDGISMTGWPCFFFFFWPTNLLNNIALAMRGVSRGMLSTNSLNNHYDTKENTKNSTNLLKTSWALHEQLLLKDCLYLWG